MKKRLFFFFAVFIAFVNFGFLGCSNGSGNGLSDDQNNSDLLFEIFTDVSEVNPTSDDIQITVTVKCHNLSKVGYVYTAGKKSPYRSGKKIFDAQDDVKILTPGKDGKYVITADQNGVYSIAAMDEDGFNIYTDRVISNIDRIPPDVVINPFVTYNEDTKQLSVEWENPEDKDFDKVQVNLYKYPEDLEDDDILVQSIEVEGTSYTVENIVADGSYYYFELCTIDKVGNISLPVYSDDCYVIPSLKVTSICADPYHLNVADGNLVNLTASISNLAFFDLYSTPIYFMIRRPSMQGDQERLTFEVYKVDEICEFVDSEKEIARLNVRYGYVNSDGTVDYSNDSEGYIDYKQGTVTVQLYLSLYCVSYEGGLFDVHVKIGDEEYAEPNLHILVSKDSRKDPDDKKPVNISVCTTQDGTYTDELLTFKKSDLNENSKLYVKINGYNLDLFVEPGIQLYDSNGRAFYAQPVPFDVNQFAWTATTGNFVNEVTVEIPMPLTDDIYKVQLVEEEVYPVSYIYSQIQVYDAVTFSKIEIPRAGISAKGNTLIARVFGKNFTAPETKISDFVLTSSSNSEIVETPDFNILNDNCMLVSLKIPETASDYQITLKNGSEQIKGTFKVRDYSAYKVGDVLLDDGTIVSVDNLNTYFTSDEAKQKAIGVMFGISDYGAPMGWVGKYSSCETNSSMKWAKEDTFASDCNFVRLQYLSTFKGYPVGKDSWELLCSIDPEGTADGAENYPAFYYAVTYGQNHNLPEAYKDGWYLPTVYECESIKAYRNNLINYIKALGGKSFFESGSYWTCEQFTADSSFYVQFNTYRRTSNRYDTNYVLVIRDFED